jgi:hypothetical protein
MSVTQVSPCNQDAVSNWQRNHPIDGKLLSECSYYPRGGCQSCKWDWPNQRCDKAHILNDTRCQPILGWIPKVASHSINEGCLRRSTSTPSQPTPKSPTAWGRSLSKIFPSLPPEIQEEIRMSFEKAGVKLTI